MPPACPLLCACCCMPRHIQSTLLATWRPVMLACTRESYTPHSAAQHDIPQHACSVLLTSSTCTPISSMPKSRKDTIMLTGMDSQPSSCLRLTRFDHSTAQHISTAGQQVNSQPVRPFTHKMCTHMHWVTLAMTVKGAVCGEGKAGTHDAHGRAKHTSQATLGQAIGAHQMTNGRQVIHSTRKRPVCLWGE